MTKKWKYCNINETVQKSLKLVLCARIDDIASFIV